MTNTIGQFTIKKELSIFQLSYNRSIKDWIDILVSLILGITNIVMILCFLYLSLDHDTMFIIFISLLIIVSGYTAYRKFSYVFLRLFSPTKQLVSIDHHKGNVTIKLPYDKTMTFKKSDIGLVVYKINTDFVEFSDHIVKQRFWVDVILVQKNKKNLTILTINPEDIIESNSYCIKKKLRKLGKGLSKALAKEMGVEYRYNKGDFLLN